MKSIKRANLIGISGRIGHGKDTLGKIIQLIHANYRDEEIVQIIEHKNLQERVDKVLETTENNYQIKKFADKLKDIVCLLIGCTRADLEDHDFKEKELGEEWWIYKTRDYGDYTIRNYNSNNLEDLHRDWKEVKLVKTTPRILLQLIGTECGRDIIHPNIWVNSLFADYHKESNWIITDCRFQNEAKAIRSKGGILIRIEIDGGKLHNHPSETSLDGYDFDYVLSNNGSIEDLIKKVKKIM